jgi:nucleobase:cation symporter-1, NCS1 family
MQSQTGQAAPKSATSVIEGHSYDYVPISERHGKPRSLFFIWFGASAHVLTAVTGAIGIAAGLGFWWTLLAIVVGNLAGAIFMAFHSAQGPQLGLPQMIQSRAQFGFYGALLVLVLVWVMYIGFAAFDVVVGGQGLSEIFPGGNTLWVIVSAAVMTLLAIYGYDWIHRSMRYQTWFYIVIFAIVAIVLIAHGVPAHALSNGHFSGGPFLLTVSAIAVFQISYAPYVSDYSRYLPPETSKHTFWYTYWGTVSVCVGLMTLGAAIAALAPALSTLAEVKVLGGHFWGPVLVFLLAFGLLPPSAMNIYGGAITTLTMGDNVRNFRSTPRLRIIASLLVAVITVLFGLIASSNVLNSFENYLGALLYFLIPWTAINLTDFYLVRHGRYRTEDFFNARGPFGLFNWRGLIVYLVTFAIEIPFMNTLVYQGPVSKQLGGADISWIVGLAVSVPLYYVLARRAVPPADAPPAAGAGAAV